MLSPAQFAELLALIQTIRDDGTRSEVRRSPRLEHPCRISITMGIEKDGGPGMLVQMKDISARGMCFLHNADLPPKTKFVARLEAPGVKMVGVRAHVVHCRQLDPHTFQIGAEFECAENQPSPLEIERTAEDWMQTRPKTIITVAPLKRPA